jgi:hypothetical protein
MWMVLVYMLLLLELGGVGEREIRGMSSWQAVLLAK